MNHLTDNAFTAYVGIDWADSKHDICVQATGDQQREFDCISHQADQPCPRVAYEREHLAAGVQQRAQPGKVDFFLPAAFQGLAEGCVAAFGHAHVHYVFTGPDDDPPLGIVWSGK